MDRFDAWCVEVDTLCRRHLACSWSDLSGDLDPLERGFADGLSAAAFVAEFKTKYDLEWSTPLDRVS